MLLTYETSRFQNLNCPLRHTAECSRKHRAINEQTLLRYYAHDVNFIQFQRIQAGRPFDLNTLDVASGFSIHDRMIHPS
jgi:hypothetical protein